MRKGRRGFLAAGLAAILLLCSLIPAIPGTHAYFDSPNASGSSLLGIRGTDHVQPALVNHTAKQLLQMFPVRKSADGYIDREVLPDNHTTGRVDFLRPPDTRREIREMIPHYFNGSKFKQTHLGI